MSGPHPLLAGLSGMVHATTGLWLISNPAVGPGGASLGTALVLVGTVCMAYLIAYRGGPA